MKKSLPLLFLLIFSLCSNVYAINWVTANQTTIAWDAVTTLGSGEPIPSGDSITYKIYLKRLPDGAETEIGETDLLEYTITFIEEGRYVVGVQTIRLPVGETEPIISSISWSDSTNIEAVPNPFGLRYFLSPFYPRGLVPK